MTTCSSIGFVFFFKENGHNLASTCTSGLLYFSLWFSSNNMLCSSMLKTNLEVESLSKMALRELILFKYY